MQVFYDSRSCSRVPSNDSFAIKSTQYDFQNPQRNLSMVCSTNGVIRNAWGLVTSYANVVRSARHLHCRVSGRHMHLLPYNGGPRRPRSCSMRSVAQGKALRVTGPKEIIFLGHMVSTAGPRVDPKKTDSIATFQTPSCRKELLSFLGLAGYYRRFICNFARLSRPL